MSGFGYIDDALNRTTTSSSQQWMTIGRVIDTNDPQQMGRVRAFCPAYGDSQDAEIKQIPWSAYVSPLGGVVDSGTRGTKKSQVTGPTAYGMWNIPKINSYVLVGCIDGDKSQRFYAGCLQPQYMPHTMPHGRFNWKDSESGAPTGPLDTHDQPIEPTFTNQQKQFTQNGNYYATGTPTNPHANMEWVTRGADTQVSAITQAQMNHPQDATGGSTPDHAWRDFESTTITEADNTKKTVYGTGYGIDQQEPTSIYESTGANYDSLTYSWTTPGFHSISMNDRHDQNRIRIRTTSGHQIIMDDTNERLYINTAGGETWIELDQQGNIDIFASRDISTHAKGDINFTADKTFRVQAKEGIHLVSDGQCRIHAKGTGGLHVKSNTNLNIESVTTTHFNVGSTLHISSGDDTNINTGAAGMWTVGGVMNLLASDNLLATASQIHLNGPSASPASPADITHESFIPSRIPEHEPWARVYSDPSLADKLLANSFVPKPSNYVDALIGKQDRDGIDIPRNPLWHR